MKKFSTLLAGAALMIGTTAMAQDNSADDVAITVRQEMRNVRQEVRNVRHEVRDVQRQVANRNFVSLSEASSFFDDDDDNDREARRRRRFRTDGNWNMDIGLNGYMSPTQQFPNASTDAYALSTFGSRYFGLTRNYSTKLGGPLYVEWGAGMSWYNFMFEDPTTRVADTDAGLVFSNFAGPGDAIKSKLVAPYINVHIVPVLDLSKGTITRSYQGRGLRVGAGGYAGYRIGGRAKEVVMVNGDRQKAKPRGSYDFADIRYGVRVQVGFRGVDLFASYDLNNVFTNAANNPQLNAFSFGLTL